MRLRPLTVRLALVAASVALASACSAQPPAAAADTQKQIDALRTQVNAMQKDLDEIKALLAPLRERQGAASEGPAIELGSRPIKGSASARLMLIELTDYQ
jgi:hypothetical protein